MQLTDVKFRDLDLLEELQEGLARCGFIQLTPVQARSLPSTLQGRDLAVQAQTGSGKTAAFLVTIFDRLLREPVEPGVSAVVLSPTRELALQIDETFQKLAAGTPIRSAVVVDRDQHLPGVAARKPQADRRATAVAPDLQARRGRRTRQPVEVRSLLEREKARGLLHQSGVERHAIARGRVRVRASGPGPWAWRTGPCARSC